MEFFRKNIELVVSVIGLAGAIVAVTLYVSSINAKAESNTFRIENLEGEQQKFDELRDKVIETNTTVRKLEEYLIPKDK